MKQQRSQHLILVLAILFTVATTFEYYYLKWHWVESVAQLLFVFVLYAGLYHGRKWGILTALGCSLIYLALFVSFLYSTIGLEPVVAFVLCLVRVLFFLSTAFVSAEICQRLAEKTVEPAAQAELDRFVLIDPQTGFYNRRFFLKRLEEELYRLDRYRSSFSVALLRLPVDLAKLAEPEISQVLRKIGSVLNKETRFSDVVTRYDLDKIAIIFPYVNKQVADVPVGRLGEKINNLLLEQGLQSPQSEPVRFTVLSTPDDLNQIKKMLEELS